MTVSRIATTNAPAAVGPYSQGVSTGQEAGSLVFVSGQVPLDPATGAVRWSYERPGAEFTYFAWSDSFFDSRYLITSPNGRYAALRVYVDWRSTLVVVLDTRTGRVTAEHTGSDNSSLQLTDTVALDGALARLDNEEILLVSGSHGLDH